MHALPSFIERLMARVVVDSVTRCWHWTGATNRKGYGVIWRAGKTELTHRACYEELVGPIPDGHQVDHECEVEDCLNPEHLNPVLPHLNNFYRNHGRVNEELFSFETSEEDLYVNSPW